MATSSLAYSSVADDASFRSWVHSLSDGLAAVGSITQTADTGQINPDTVLKPTATAVAAGYQVWRFNDALQATRPIFFKLEYGSGSSVINSAGVWITIGSGSDGAGNLTGVVIGRRQLYGINQNTASTTRVCGTAGRIIFMTGIAAHATNPIMFCIERWKDPATGADTGEGYWTWTWSYAASYWAVVPQTGVTAVGSTGSGTTPGFLVAANAGPFVSPAGFPMSVGANVAISPMILFYGGHRGAICLVATNTADFTAFTTFTVANYGGNHTYMALGFGCAMLWE
jgi:hypothetical protein